MIAEPIRPEHNFIWIFCGDQSVFPSGVFSEEALARRWIKQHKLSGCLTAYPVDIGAYEWAVKNGYFLPKKPHHSSSQFIGKFTSGAQLHFHFVDGEP